MLVLWYADKKVNYTYLITTPLNTLVSCIKFPDNSKEGFSGSFCSSSFVGTLGLPNFFDSSSTGSFFTFEGSTLTFERYLSSERSFLMNGASLSLLFSCGLELLGDRDLDRRRKLARSLDLDLDRIVLIFRSRCFVQLYLSVQLFLVFQNFKFLSKIFLFLFWFLGQSQIRLEWFKWQILRHRFLWQLYI